MVTLLGVLQVGQFMGTRADFIPKPVCKKLSLLQDKVYLWLSPPLDKSRSHAGFSCETLKSATHTYTHQSSDRFQ